MLVIENVMDDIIRAEIVVRAIHVQEINLEISLKIT
jgi:hypothetical protein